MNGSRLAKPWAMNRRAMTFLLPLALLATLLVAVPTVARPGEARAVEPPPGGIADSPANVDRLEGKFSVSDDGVAQYDLPLWVSQGRRDVTPELSLSYRSNAGNGFVGVGWSLNGLPTISPCPRTIAQDGATDGVHFDGSDAFCLDGNRLMPLGPESGGQREYRTEQESFGKIVASGMQNGVPDSFQVFAKDGRSLTFGGTADSKLQAFRLKAGTEPNTLVRESTTVRRTAAWSVNKVADHNGNEMTVEYEEVEGSEAELWHVESRPKTIRYAPNREVRFTYVERPDPIETYMGGLHLREPRRLSKIEMLGGPQGQPIGLLREYGLEYRDDSNDSITKRSLLNKISACDKKGACLVPLLFDWSMGSYDFDPVDMVDVKDAGQQPGSSERDNRIFVGDVDGDGKDDITYVSTEAELRVGTKQAWRVRRSIGSGFTAKFSDAEAAGFEPPTHCPGQIQPCVSGRAEIRTIDANLDGRLDVMVWVPWSPTERRWVLFQSNGSSFSPSAFQMDLGPDAGLDPDPVYFGDINGDASPDFITAPYDKTNPDPHPFFIDGPWSYSLNDGRGGPNGFGSLVSTGIEKPLGAASGRLVDVNGDNRLDLVGFLGWGLNAAGVSEERPTSFADGVRGDVNGDGLADRISATADPCAFPRPATLQVVLNSGNGTGPLSTSPANYREPRWRCIQTSPPGAPNPTFELDLSFSRGVKVADFNGDEMDDVLVFRGGTPSGPDDTDLGVQLYTWRNGAFERADLSQYAGNPANTGFTASHVLDFDGDGMLDILHVEGDHLRVLRRRGGKPDLLTGVGNFEPRDRVRVRYSNFANRLGYTPLASTYPLVSATSDGNVVAGHSIVNFLGADGVEGEDSYTHSYEGGRLDAHRRDWLGFSKHTVSRLLTGESWTTELDNVTRDTSGPSVYPFAGLPKKVTHEIPGIHGGGPYRMETVYGRTLVRRPGGGYTIETRTVTETEQERILGEFQTLRANTTTTSYDAFGNQGLVVSHTTGGRRITTERTFRNDTARWLIGLPTHELVTGCTPANECRTRESRFDYDPVTGNPTLTVVEPNSSDLELTLTTTTAYGESGTVTSITTNDHKPDGMPKQVRKESFEYDADLLHPTARINHLDPADTVDPVDQRTRFETHSGLGVTTRTEDPNGVPTTMQYDRFGRLVATFRADGSSEITIRSHQASTGGQASTTFVSGGGSTTVAENRLGQQTERKVKAFDGHFASTHTVYDEFGRVHKVSRPAFEGETLQFTVTSYDDRNRVKTIVAPDGATVHTSYSGRQSTTRDAKGIDSTIVTNVDGDVESRTEFNPESASTEPLETRFEYAHFGEPAKMIAPDDTALVMLYDIRGQRESLQDPSSGLTTTTYTAFGEVDTEKNAESEVTDYDYDPLGRVVKTTTKDGVAVNKWDTAPNGIGKLVNAKSADGVGGVGIDYRYNPQGKPQSTQWRIGNDVFKVDYDYDTIGRPSTMTYPAVLGTTDRLKVANVYSQHGYLAQVKDVTGLTGARVTAPCSDADRAEGRCLWTGNNRDAAGQLTLETYGNGVATTNIYEPRTGLLDRTTATGPGTVGTLADLDYGYDLNRNVVKRDDLVNNRLDRYQHDELNRLKKWQIFAAPDDRTVLTADYTYDQIGNLKTEGVTRTGQPRLDITYSHGEDGAPAHRLTSRDTTAFTYDKVGRQISGDRRGITYTAANLPRTITWGQNNDKQSVFAYDPNGARVSKVDNDQTLITIPGVLERHNPAGTDSTQVHNIHYVTVDGRVVAQVNKIQDRAQPTGPIVLSQTTYLHQDLQGSTHLVTNPAGREVGNEGGFAQNLYYDPWGQRLDTDSQPLGRQRRAHRLGYTNQFHDDELGLIDMKGRIYSPADRRFTTPDPFIQDPLSSQSHNRYAFVWNNPTTNTDPTGFVTGSLVDRDDSTSQLEVHVYADDPPQSFNPEAKADSQKQAALNNTADTDSSSKKAPTRGKSKGNKTSDKKEADPDCQGCTVGGKGGKQNWRDTGLEKLTDDQLAERYKHAEGKEKLRIQKEQKVRKQRHRAGSDQRKPSAKPTDPTPTGAKPTVEPSPLGQPLAEPSAEAKPINEPTSDPTKPTSERRIITASQVFQAGAALAAESARAHAASGSSGGAAPRLYTPNWGPATASTPAAAASQSSGNASFAATLGAFALGAGLLILLFTGALSG